MVPLVPVGGGVNLGTAGGGGLEWNLRPARRLLIRVFSSIGIEGSVPKHLVSSIKPLTSTKVGWSGWCSTAIDAC